MFAYLHNCAIFKIIELMNIKERTLVNGIAFILMIISFTTTTKAQITENTFPLIHLTKQIYGFGRLPHQC
jgi:hypothetical protein